MFMKKLLVVAALVMSTFGPERSGAATDWETFGLAMDRTPIAVKLIGVDGHGKYVGGTRVSLKATTELNPVSIRVSVTGPRQVIGLDLNATQVRLYCWNSDRDRLGTGAWGEVKRFEDHGFPATFDVSNTVRGGVKSWRRCEVDASNFQNRAGTTRMFVQVRYP
jgi:hypothetical protein